METRFWTVDVARVLLSLVAGLGLARTALAVDTLVSPDPDSCPDGAALTFAVPTSNPLRVAWAIETVESLNAAGNCIELVTVNFFDDSDPCGGLIPRSVNRPEVFDDDPATTIPGYDDCGYDGFFVAWIHGLYPDIDRAYRSTSTQNTTQYRSAEFDALADDWLGTHDLASRLEKAEGIQWLLHEDEPHLTLFYMNDLWLWSPDVSGFDVAGTLSRADRLRVADGSDAPLRYLTRFEIPGPLHPWYYQDVGTMDAIGAVHASLGRRGAYPDHSVLEPDLASWSIDGNAVTFTLNPCRQWHDGSRVTTQDVAASLAHNPELQNTGAVVGIDVRSASTVVVHLAPDFRALTFVATTPILQARVARRFDASVFERAAWGADPPIGAGPYRLVSAQLAQTPSDRGAILGDLHGIADFASEYPGAGRDLSVGHSFPVYLSTTLERFPAYDACMGDATGAPDTLVVQAEPDRDAALALLASGDPVVLSTNYQLWNVRDVVDADSGVFSSVIEQVVELNNQLPLLDSAAERRALSCAIDRAALVSEFLPEADRATPGITPWMPAHEGFVSDIEPNGPANPACDD